MAKLWFLDYMGRALVPARMRHACQLMGFDDKITDFIMARFAHHQGMYGAEVVGISEFSQRKMMPELDLKVMGWAESNRSFFSLPELAVLTVFYRKRCV